MKFSPRILFSTLLPFSAFLGGCSAEERASETETATEEPGSGEPEPGDRHRERSAMVERQLAARGISSQAVLSAMRAVPRHRFVPASVAEHAYLDRPLPIGHQQTISQPYVVAFMTQAAGIEPGDRVLEIGTGSGYQAAVLSELLRAQGAQPGLDEGELWTIEIVEPLARSASAALEACGYDNVHVRTGDGYRGWSEEAPFDVILLTAAPDHVPQPLLDQLAIGGRMVLPVGDFDQEVVRIVKTESGLEREELLPVRFVPMTGEARTGEARTGAARR